MTDEERKNKFIENLAWIGARMSEIGGISETVQIAELIIAVKNGAIKVK